jgi:hypothetical protein
MRDLPHRSLAEDIRSLGDETQVRFVSYYALNGCEGGIVGVLYRDILNPEHAIGRIDARATMLKLEAVVLRDDCHAPEYGTTRRIGKPSINPAASLLQSN